MKYSSWRICQLVKNILALKLKSESRKSKPEDKNGLDEAFAKNGFPKKIRDAKICICVNNKEYRFDYETNKVLKIEEYNVVLAVCEKAKEKILFINKDFNPSASEYTSPYRTFWPGLMKEPFNLCYPLNNEVVIYTSQKEIIKVWIEA